MSPHLSASLAKRNAMNPANNGKAGKAGELRVLGQPQSHGMPPSSPSAVPRTDHLPRDINSVTAYRFFLTATPTPSCGRAAGVWWRSMAVMRCHLCAVTPKHQTAVVGEWSRAPIHPALACLGQPWLGFQQSLTSSGQLWPAVWLALKGYGSCSLCEPCQIL
jgi:hypothetical protein